MRRGVRGKVGTWDLKWDSVPRGDSGSAFVELKGGKKVEIRWRRDASGIWLESPDGVWGFDAFGEVSDEGITTLRITRRLGDDSWSGLSFVRVGDQQGALSGTRKRGARVKSQMPGKIVRVLVRKGQAVEKGQPLLVMEAMKMENEICAHQGGRIGEVRVSEGQAVECGAELLAIEAE